MHRVVFGSRPGLPALCRCAPVTLLDFLKSLEETAPEGRPTVSVLVDCGFWEYRQNEVAVRMVQFFCRRNGSPFGSALIRWPNVAARCCMQPCRSNGSSSYGPRPAIGLATGGALALPRSRCGRCASRSEQGCPPAQPRRTPFCDLRIRANGHADGYAKKKELIISSFFAIECPGQESNLHALRHTHLKRARLPIPPPGHGYAPCWFAWCKGNTFLETSAIFREKN